MWKDVTPYSKSTPTKGRVPTTFDFKARNLRICITNNHIDFRGKWVMYCSDLNMSTVQMKGCTTADEAKARAVEVVRTQLETLLADLEQATRSTKTNTK